MLTHNGVFARWSGRAAVAMESTEGWLCGQAMRLARDERGEVIEFLLMLGLLATLAVGVFAIIFPGVKESISGWMVTFRDVLTFHPPSF